MDNNDEIQSMNKETAEELEKQEALRKQCYDEIMEILNRYDLTLVAGTPTFTIDPEDGKMVVKPSDIYIIETSRVRK